MRLIRLLKSDLAKEVDSWTQADIISSEQAQAICSRYGIAYPLEENHRAYDYLMGFAYFFLALALIILIGHNWEDMSRGLRMAGLVSITVATHAVAFYQWTHDKQGKGIALFALGNMFFGASIILIAQIYHLGEHMPDGVFWWALGSLPFALITRSRLIMLQVLFLAFIWFFMESSLGFYPLTFPLFIAATLYVLYQNEASYSLFLGFILALGFWFEYSLMFLWRDGFRIELLFENIVLAASLASLFYAASKRLMAQTSIIAQDYGAILSVWILRFMVLGLIIFSFKGAWRDAIRHDWPEFYSMLALMTLLGLASILLAIERTHKMLLALVSGGLFAVVFALYVVEDKSLAVLFQVVDNVLLIVAGIYLIHKGLSRGESHYFFFGMVTILLTALIRYFDLIGDYIGGALLFGFFAVVLIVSAKLFWRQQNKNREAS